MSSMVSTMINTQTRADACKAAGGQARSTSLCAPGPLARTVLAPRATVLAGRSSPNLTLRGPVAPRVAFTDTQGDAGVGVQTLDPAQEPVALEDVQTLTQLWPAMAKAYGNAPALLEPHRKPAAVSYSFRELKSAIDEFGAGIRSLGLETGERVALFSENSSRWLVADQGTMAAGGVDAVRGASNSVEELTYIALDSGATGLIVQDGDTLDRLLEGLTTEFEDTGKIAADALKYVIVLWGEPSEAACAGLGCDVHTFDAVIAAGKESIEANGGFAAHVAKADDIATLVYTSGTTGHPKGAKLSHGNLVYQVHNLSSFMDMQPGNRLLSLLPPWHIYERSVEYTVLRHGVEVVYSGIRTFKDDLGKFKPNFFVCVPLVLDTLYTRVMDTVRKGSAVKKALVETFLKISGIFIRAQRRAQGAALADGTAPPGPFAVMLASIIATVLAPVHALATALAYGKIRDALGIQTCVVSGGGSLAPRLDDFYETIGLPVINGWGLTETSPVLACRNNSTEPGRNVRGTIGLPTPGTTVRVVDPETLKDVPDGSSGLLLASGPGVMQGYWNNEEATAKAFPQEGWFDTGDLGMRIPESNAHKMGGQYAITGRAKDTIVLSSGENVEPQPIEDAVTASDLIQHAIVMGQDHRSLGALLCLNEDNVAALKEANPGMTDADVEKAVKAEVTALNRGRREYEPFHRITAIKVLAEPFSLENGTLTRTMKPRRPYIADFYASDIEELMSHLR